MRVDVSRSGRRFELRLHLEEPDPTTTRHLLSGQELFLARDHYAVDLPESFRDIHPDLHATAILMAVRPFVGRELTLPFGVSSDLQELVEGALGIRLTRGDAALRPRTAPADGAPALLYSGGFDTSAASLVLPARTHVLNLDPRLPPPDVTGPFRTQGQRMQAQCDKLVRLGRTVHRVAEDHERLFGPFPVWYVGDKMAWLAALYLADSLDVGFVETGHILEDLCGTGHRFDHADGWPLFPRDVFQGGAGGLTRVLAGDVDPPIFAASREEEEEARQRRLDRRIEPQDDVSRVLGFQFRRSLGGLSTVGSIFLVARGPYAGEAAPCDSPVSFDSPRTAFPPTSGACMECPRCFLKGVVADIAVGRETPRERVAHFLAMPKVAEELRGPFLDFHHVWYYAFQRLRCAHPWALELQRQAQRGPDLAALEKWQPASARLMPEAYRDEVVRNITALLETMTPAEAAGLAATVVPPLDLPAPDGTRTAGADTRRAAAPAARAPAAAAARGPSDAPAGGAAGPAGAAEVTPAWGAWVEPHTALNITRRCNQDCIFCFEGDRTGWTEPDQSEVERLLAAASKRTSRVIFMGGEALLRRDILPILRHAHSLGVAVDAFTNGQVLARPGFVGELAETGLRRLQISFHYADADSFARGTRRPAKNFDTLLEALRRVAEHNEQHPERSFRVGVETNCFRHNAGRLADMTATLRDVLGSSYTAQRIGAMTPCRTKSPDEYLLEPLAERRAELAALLPSLVHAVDVELSKLPLCLAPGFEHLSNDVVVRAQQLAVLSNFQDRGSLGDLNLIHEKHRTNPYLWVCRDCTLLGLCPTLRTSREHPSFAPRRDQKPIPFTGLAARDVLVRIIPPAQVAAAAAAAEEIAERARSLHRLGGRLLAAVRAHATDSVPAPELWCAREPRVDVEVPDPDGGVHLRLVEARPGEETSIVAGWVTARVLRGTPPPGLRTALAALGAEAVPEDWAQDEDFRAVLADTSALWGDRLWVGAPWPGGLRLEGIVPEEGPRVRLRLALPDGASAEVVCARSGRGGGEDRPQPLLGTARLDVGGAWPGPAARDPTPGAALRAKALLAAALVRAGGAAVTRTALLHVLLTALQRHPEAAVLRYAERTGTRLLDALSPRFDGVVVEAADEAGRFTFELSRRAAAPGQDGVVIETAPAHVPDPRRQRLVRALGEFVRTYLGRVPARPGGADGAAGGPAASAVGGGQPGGVP